MAANVAEHLLARLREWGIHRIYGYPGDGINAIIGALDRVSFGSPPDGLQALVHSAAAFDAAMLRASRPGSTLGALFAEVDAEYDRQNFPTSGAAITRAA